MTQQEMFILVPRKLRQIEKEYGIHVLYAAETGSRAWGTNAETSDFDVRFIYIRPQKDYLRLDPAKDVLEFPIKEGWDICGWDLTKLLQLLRNSNTQIFEWFASPVVYVDDGFTKRLKPLLDACFSSHTAVFHYLHLAKVMMEMNQKVNPVRVKYYLNSLQHISVARWILTNQALPPVNFRQLIPTLPEPLHLQARNLLFLKTTHPEQPTVLRSSHLDNWLLEEHRRIRQEISTQPRQSPQPWEMLNRFFLAELEREMGWRDHHASLISNVQAGDSVFFGRYAYESESDIRPIEWTVLESSETDLLLISRYCLDTVTYCAPGSHSAEDCIWETSFLRNWLNHHFYHRAFSKEEAQYILDTRIVTRETSDLALHQNKVFLLSSEQVSSLFINDADRTGIPTPYAVRKGAYKGEDDAACWWVLPETPKDGPGQNIPCLVLRTDHTNQTASHSRLVGSSLAHRTTVRPAIRVRKEVADRVFQKNPHW